MYAGDMQPPLTVVLINNGGGGIFSFLPIADAVMPEVFTPLWATPQNVDLAGVLSLLPNLSSQVKRGSLVPTFPWLDPCIWSTAKELCC